MAAITVTDGVFGTKGTNCPATLYKMVDYSRHVDFEKYPVADNANYKLIPIPKGFLVLDIAVEQTKLTAQDIALTFKCDTDVTPVQLGGTFTLDDAALLRKCDAAAAGVQPTIALSGTVNTTTGAVDGVTATASGGSGAGAQFFSEARTLCVCVPDGLTGEKAASGAFTVHVIGYQTFGESLGDVPANLPAWATGQTAEQAAANTSGGDPMFQQP